MNDVIRSRLLVLVGLAVLGVGVAGTGATLGVAESLPNTGAPAEFVVSEGNVTVTAGGESKPVLTNLTNVREITIEETNAGRFAIQTTEEQPLTESERERARTIAVNNETVEQALDTMSEYELSVEPIQRLNRSAQVSFNVSTEINRTTGVVRGEVANDDTATGNREDESVTIDRDPSYVEDRAVVRIRQPVEDERHDLKYSVDVDLANETVTDVTDWDELRQGPQSATETTEVNYPDLPHSGLPAPRLLRTGLPVSVSEFIPDVGTGIPDSAGDFPLRAVWSVPLLPVGHSATTDVRASCRRSKDAVFRDDENRRFSDHA